MTLATLNYIHSLLEREEETRRNAKKLAVQSRDQAEEAGADNVPVLWEQVEKARESWFEANSALRDFEAQEW